MGVDEVHNTSLVPTSIYVRDTTAWNKVRQAVFRGEYVAIVGPKSSGKTLLLRDALDSLQEEGFLCIYIDLDSWRIRNPRGLFRQLAQTIQISVPDHTQLELTLLPDDIQDSQDFRHFLSSLLPAVPDTVVVALDHIESLPRYLAKALLRCFRVIYSERDVRPEYYEFVVLATGALNLFNLTVSPVSPFNIATLVSVPDANDEQSRALIEKVVRQTGIQFSAKATLCVLEATGGDYYLIQYLCQLASQQPRWTSPRVAEPAVRRALADIAASDPQNNPYLAERIRMVEADPSVLKTVLDVLAGSDVKRRELSTAIDSLELTGVIKVTRHRYVVRSKVWGQVLRRYFTPRRVARLFSLFGRWDDAIHYFELGDPSVDRTERAEYLAAVINRIYVEGNEREAIQSVVRALETGFRVQKMVVYQVVEDGQKLVPVICRGLDRYNQDTFINLHERSEQVEARACYDNDYLLEEDKDGNSLFVFPLLSGGHLPISGVVTLYNHFSIDRFVEQQNEALEITGFLSQAGRAIARLRERQELLRCEQQRVQTLVSLSEVTEAIAAVRKLEDLLLLIVESARTVLDADVVTMYLYDTEEQRFHTPVGTGLQNEQEFHKLSLPLSDGQIAGKVISERQSLILEDVINHPGAHKSPFIRYEGIHSVAGFPLLRANESEGVLFVSYRSPHSFSSSERQIITTFANHAAIALQNARLFDETQVGLKQFRLLYEAGSTIISTMDPRHILEVVVKGACQALEGWRAKIALSAEEGKFKDLVSVGFEGGLDASALMRQDGISARVITSGEPWYTNDAQKHPKVVNPAMLNDGVRAAACVPFDLGGHTIGVMWLHYKQPRRFLPTETEALRLYVNKAAIAYDNARRMQELGRLRLAAEKLASVVGVQEVLQQIVVSAREVLEAASAVIWSFDSARRTFLPDELVADGIESDLLERFRRDEPTTGGTAEIVMERAHLAVPNILDPEYTFLGPTARGLRGKIGVRAFQGIALRVGDEQLGVLYVNYSHVRNFSQDEETTLRMFASHAALTLKSARLLEQIRKARDTAVFVAEASVLEDLDKTLHSIAEGTLDVLDCDAVTLYTYDRNADRLGYPPIMTGVKHREKVTRLLDVSRDSIVFKMLMREDLLVVEDTSKNQLFKDLRFVIDEQIITCVVIPLKVGNQKVGVMFLNYRTPHRFTGEEFTNIMLFSHQAAVAIHNALLLSSITHRTKQLQAVVDVSGTTSTILAPEELISKAVSLICDSFEFYYVGLFLTDEAREYAVLRASSGEAGQRMLEEKHKLVIGGKSMIGQSIDKAEARIALDVGKEATRFDNPHLPDTRSELALPLISHSKCIGALTVQSVERAAFSAQDIDVLQAMADGLAIAIENALLYQARMEYEQALKAIQITSAAISAMLDLSAGLPMIANTAADIFKAPAVSLMLWDKTKENMVITASKGLSEEYVQGQHISREKVHAAVALANGSRSFVTPNLLQEPLGEAYLIEREGLCSVLSTMLSVYDQLTGVLNVYSKGAPRRFTHDEKELAEIFANQGAIAIHNARLYEESQKRTAHLLALYEAVKIITASSGLDQEQILDNALRQAISITGIVERKATIGTIQLLDEETNELVFSNAYPKKALSGLTAKLGDRQPLDKEKAKDGKIGVTGRVAITQLVQSVPDVREDPDYIVYDQSTKSELAVPLLDDNRTFGILNVESDEIGDFDENDEETLKYLADLAVVAIKNAEQAKKLGRTNAIALMGAWGAEMVHDMNRELGAIRRAVYILLQDSSLSPESQEYLNRIDRHAEALDLPDLPERKWEPGYALEIPNAPRLDNVIQDELVRFEPAYPSVCLQSDLKCPRVQVAVHKQWLRRLLRHLIYNAITAIPPDKESKLVTIRTAIQGFMAEVQVEDNGNGIPTEIERELFQRPISRGDSRLGRGLLLVKFLAEQHGGEIKLVWNRPGEGACFALSIPLVQ